VEWQLILMWPMVLLCLLACNWWLLSWLGGFIEKRPSPVSRMILLQNHHTAVKIGEVARVSIVMKGLLTAVALAVSRPLVGD